MAWITLPHNCSIIPKRFPRSDAEILQCLQANVEPIFNITYINLPCSLCQGPFIGLSERAFFLMITINLWIYILVVWRVLYLYTLCVHGWPFFFLMKFLLIKKKKKWRVLYLWIWKFIGFSCQLHQLMPSVVTCLVAKKLGNRFADDHWELRDFTANLVASICKRWDFPLCYVSHQGAA